MKKIYITSLHMMHGGVEMAITLLANALVKRNYNVEILCIYYLGEPAYKVDERVKITYLSKVHPNREEFKKAVASHNVLHIIREGLYAVKVLYLKRQLLVQKFKKIDEGIIISTRNEHSVLLSKYGSANVKKIAQLHHDHKFDKKLFNDFSKRYGRIDVFVLLTEVLWREVQKIMKKNKHTKCVVIPNFLENIVERNQEERICQVVSVGRLHEVKGFPRLIEIWKELDVEDKPILKIIGDGDEKKKLQDIIVDNHLENFVILTGAMSHEDAMKEMRQSLFYVMTSFSEAFPFVLIEAMANGLPAVTFDVRVGPGAIVEDSVSGFLIPDGDKEEFVKRVQLLIEDDSLRNQMSEAAFERSQEFTENNVMKKWIEILEV